MVELKTVHGGHNDNAVGSRGNGFLEEKLTNDLAQRVAKLTSGCVYIPQDSGDVNQNLRYLVNEMDRINNGSNPNLANLSIHFNAFSDPNAHGTEAWIAKDFPLNGTDGVIASQLSNSVATVLGTNNRGVKNSQGLYVIQNSKAVTTLLEVCFLTSTSDMDRYNKNIDNVAHAIAKCYSNYVGGGSVTPNPTPIPPVVKPPVTPPSTGLPSGFTPENSTFKVTVDSGIQVRKGDYGLNATKAGILGKNQSINYDGWASRDGYIWVHYTGDSGDQLFLPVRPVGQDAWGSFS